MVAEKYCQTVRFDCTFQMGAFNFGEKMKSHGDGNMQDGRMGPGSE